MLVQDFGFSKTIFGTYSQRSSAGCKAIKANVSHITKLQICWHRTVMCETDNSVDSQVLLTLQKRKVHDHNSNEINN